MTLTSIPCVWIMYISRSLWLVVIKSNPHSTHLKHNSYPKTQHNKKYAETHIWIVLKRLSFKSAVVARYHIPNILISTCCKSKAIFQKQNWQKKINIIRTKSKGVSKKGEETLRTSDYYIKLLLESKEQSVSPSHTLSVEVRALSKLYDVVYSGLTSGPGLR